MRVRTLSVICLLACLIVIPTLAQPQADPLSGTWAGDWGPNAQDRNQVSVDLKLNGKAVTGVVKTANRPEVSLSSSTYDSTTRTVKMEAEAKNPRSGQSVKYVIEGKVEGNSMTGTWNHDNVKGDFKLTKK
ncbi:MAG TPA: hypothetical protein VFR18_18975 [Terriglobia bacterium]|nr:hypothetical protein [Terriglobia bacterium]